MSDDKPKWTRRKDDRPGELISAALDLFIEKGFSATKLSEVAACAGVAKGTVYRYFDTKEDLFRAVVRDALSSNLRMIERASARTDTPLAELLPGLLVHAASQVSDSRLPAILRMVVADSRTLPDLATIWHDEVIVKALGLLTELIAAAQARGEIREGDPALYAFSLVGPLVTGVLFREVFGQGGRLAPDLQKLTIQHLETVLRGWSVE